MFGVAGRADSLPASVGHLAGLTADAAVAMAPAPFEYPLGRGGDRGLRFNAEWIHVDHSPVGYTAYPMPVGAKGNVFHLNFEMNF